MNPHAASTPIPSTEYLTTDQLAASEQWHYWRDHFSHPPLFNDLVRSDQPAQ